MRRWGRVDTDGRRAETWLDDLFPALTCAEAHAKAKLRRGYNPVDEVASLLDGKAQVRLTAAVRKGRLWDAARLGTVFRDAAGVRFVSARGHSIDHATTEITSEGWTAPA